MSLEGTLSYLDIAHLLKVVGAARKSGELVITWQDRRARLLFQSGRMIRAESNQKHPGIGTLLVRAGRLGEADLARALEIQRADVQHRRLGAILCDEFGVDPREMERLLAQQFQQIVYDVFSWPSGSFRFEFTEPAEIQDRFHLNPSEFILAVGVKAGLLAREGEELEHEGSVRRTVLLLVEHADLRACGQERARRMGWHVLGFDSSDALVERLEDWASVGPTPVVVVDLDGPWRAERDPVVDRVRDAMVGVPVVGVAVDADRADGVDVAVRRPADADLDGPASEHAVDLFGLSLERALRDAVGRMEA